MRRYKRRTQNGADFPWDSQAEMDLLRHFCRDNFWAFFLYAFGAGRNPKGDKWIDESVHRPLAEWFEYHVKAWEAERAENQRRIENQETPKPMQRKLAVVIPRELGKTTMITQAGQLWLHLRDPEMSTYTGSERTELSQKILEGVKAVLDGSDPYAMFPKLYGTWSGSARKWTGKEITHAARRNTSRKDPSFGTFAVETSIVGAHPDAWFEDDPISYERLTSDSNWLGAVNSQVVSMVPVVQSDGLIVWPGTRYDDSDHFGTAFSEEGVASVSGMTTDSIVVDPENGQWHVYFLAARDKDNQPTAPKVWPEVRLAAYQRRDPLRYASQVMNDPSISEHNPITRDQIQQCKVQAKDVPWTALRYAICCDTAFFTAGQRASKDETVFIVHGYPRNGAGDVYVVEVHGSPTWRAEDYGRRLAAKVQQYRKQGRRVFAITDEMSPGKTEAWKIALRNFFHDANEPMPQFIEYNRNKGPGKVQRMVTAATYWVDGHVRWVEGAPGVDRLVEQMAKIGQMMVNPKMKDDYADAHADAFQPELYTPMRRAQQGKPPWERGATAFDTPGLNLDEFDDSRGEIGREPLQPLR